MTDEADAAGAWAELEAVLAPLLRSMEALGFIARYLHPPDFVRVMDAAGSPETPLRAARPALEAWTGALEPVAEVLANAADETLGAFDELRAATDIGAVFRALRHGPRAREALYPLATVLPPVGRFFLDPQSRADSGLAARLEGARARPDTGVLHRGNAPGERGGYSMYVPEDYAPDRPWPLVMALHGGSGHGRGFLWSWLASARSHGAILVAPTATGGTWALGGEDIDTPNLRRILDEVRGGWSIDPARLLLTGMSDGGTFTYFSGLEGGSPFTHLAPIAASFHRFLADMADPGRLRDLPIHIVHGALDWMFDVAMARQADRALSAAGARVTYLEVDDLSHTYPHEANRLILKWLDRP